MSGFLRRVMPPQLQCNALSNRAFGSFFSPLPPIPVLSPREVHVWYVVPNEVKDASLIRKYMYFLSPGERETVLSIKEDAVRFGTLLSRALVRTTLSRYTGYRVHPRSFEFRKNSFGKPEVEWQHDNLWDPPSLQFNISHTSSLIACGVTIDVPIGIDIEEKQRKPSHGVLSLAQRFFSPAEVEYLSTFKDPEKQQKQFIRLWTLKEAYVKALGRGFSGAPFRGFTICMKAANGDDGHICGRSVSEREKIIVEDDLFSQNLEYKWQFALPELDDSHYAAICVGAHKKNISCAETDSLKVRVWKTVPFIEDICVSTDEHTL